MCTEVKKGDRIRLISMPNDPNPIPIGSTGTVESVTTGPLGQVRVRWDGGRSLHLIPGVDRFEVIERSTEANPATRPEPVRVPAAVYEGIAAARDSGMFNMLDLPAIAGLTRQMGYDEAADWLIDRSNRRAYAEGVFQGFAPEE